MSRKDPEGATVFLLRTAIIKSKEGEEASFADWKDGIRRCWTDLKRTKARIVVEEVVPRGEEVEVRYTQTLNGIWTDPHPGNEHAFVFEWKLLATMRKTDQGWRASRVVELDGKATFDGNPIELERPKDKP